MLALGGRSMPTNLEQPPSKQEHDNPLERLELLAGDEQAIESFLDEIDVRSPREREMLTELARKRTIARPERLAADHRRAIVALESLRRHGFHGSRAASRLGPLRAVARWGVELVARYIVVSYVRSVVSDLRNLYWLREIEAPTGRTNCASRGRCAWMPRRSSTSREHERSAFPRS